jgi:hypothetical protein
MNQKYFNDYMKKNEHFYNLEKEKNNNIINLKNNNGASSNIVEEFFLRQINDNEDNFS